MKAAGGSVYAMQTGARTKKHLNAVRFDHFLRNITLSVLHYKIRFKDGMFSVTYVWFQCLFFICTSKKAASKNLINQVKKLNI